MFSTRITYLAAVFTLMQQPAKIVSIMDSAGQKQLSCLLPRWQLLVYCILVSRSLIQSYPLPMLIFVDIQISQCFCMLSIPFFFFFFFDFLFSIYLYLSLSLFLLFLTCKSKLQHLPFTLVSEIDFSCNKKRQNQNQKALFTPMQEFLCQLKPCVFQIQELHIFSLKIKS